MIRFIVFLYLLLYAVYLPFSRTPDYFDGEHTSGTVLLENGVWKARYFVNNRAYLAELHPFLGAPATGEKVDIVYDPQLPAQGVVPALFGYWLQWHEFFYTALIYFGLFGVAKLVVQNPSPEALIEQLENEQKPARRRRKYD